MLAGLEDEERRQGFGQGQHKILHKRQNSPLFANNLSVASNRMKIIKIQRWISQKR